MLVPSPVIVVWNKQFSKNDNTTTPILILSVTNSNLSSSFENNSEESVIIYMGFLQATQSHTLYLPKLNGGLGCPNFAYYYRAAHIASFVKYHAYQETPLWVSIEATECDPIPIYNLLWISPKDLFSRMLRFGHTFSYLVVMSKSTNILDGNFLYCN